MFTRSHSNAVLPPFSNALKVSEKKIISRVDAQTSKIGSLGVKMDYIINYEKRHDDSAAVIQLNSATMTSQSDKIQQLTNALQYKNSELSEQEESHQQQVDVLAIELEDCGDLISKLEDRLTTTEIQLESMTRKYEALEGLNACANHKLEADKVRFDDVERDFVNIQICLLKTKKKHEYYVKCNEQLQKLYSISQQREHEKDVMYQSQLCVIQQQKDDELLDSNIKIEELELNQQNQTKLIEEHVLVQDSKHAELTNALAALHIKQQHDLELNHAVDLAVQAQSYEKRIASDQEISHAEKLQHIKASIATDKRIQKLSDDNENLQTAVSFQMPCLMETECEISSTSKVIDDFISEINT